MNKSKVDIALLKAKAQKQKIELLKLQSEQSASSKGLTILSFGGGQDSTALFYKLVEDPKFRDKYAPDDLIVVMAQTGNEYPETYKHVKNIQSRSKKEGIPFFFLDDYEFTAPSWKGGVVEKMRKDKSVIMVKQKSCSVALKISTIYKWLDHWLAENYDLEAEAGRGKPALLEFAKKHGKIKVLLGIAKGEEKRIERPLSSDPKWMQNGIEKIYPMIDIGMDRMGAQEYVASLGEYVPPPSNCMMCPYQSNQEILYLARKYPSTWKQWVKLEQAKIDKWAEIIKKDPINPQTGKARKNLGVYATKRLLPEKLKLAEEKHGKMTMEDLEAYRFSHGHCAIQTSY